MKDGFMTPPEHVNFEAKKLFGSMGRIIDGSIAYISMKEEPDTRRIIETALALGKTVCVPNR